MVRKATPADLDAIAAIYDDIHTEEEAGRSTIGWIRTIYPTRKSAEDSIAKGDMFVLEVDGAVVAAAKINQEQVPEYGDAQWEYPASDDQVMVLHTLVVSPKRKGKGYGSQFVDFYEAYARKNNCPYLRMDTNERNLAARALYKKLGYTEVGIVPCEFNGIPGVRLVCLEKKTITQRETKDFNAMLQDSKDMPKLQLITDEASIAKYGGNRMYFAPPLDYDRVMKTVPWGRVLTVGDIRAHFAKTNGADFTEPTTAGIFVSIAAWASHQRAQDETPYWRTLKANGELNPKYPGGVLAQKEKLEAEGHTILQKGRKNLRYYVKDYEAALFQLD